MPSLSLHFHWIWDLTIFLIGFTHFESSHNTEEEISNQALSTSHPTVSIPAHANNVNGNNDFENLNKIPKITEAVKFPENSSASHHSNLAKIEQEIMHEELIGKNENIESSKYLGDNFENKGSSHRIENIMKVASSADENNEENRNIFRNAVKEVQRKRYNLDDFRDESLQNFPKYEVKERTYSPRRDERDESLQNFLKYELKEKTYSPRREALTTTCYQGWQEFYYWSTPLLKIIWHEA